MNWQIDLAGFRMEKPRYFQVIERIFVLASMLVFFRAFIFLFLTDASKGPGNSIGQITANHSNLLFIYISIYCITALLVTRHWRGILELAYREKFLLMLLVLAVFSALWSVNPQITLARSVAMSGTTLFGVYFALRFSHVEQLKLLAWASIIVIGFSYVGAIGFPEIGLMKGYHQGLWRGVFIHKNLLGVVIPLGSITFFILAATHTRWRHWYWFWFWLALVLLTLTGSKSSLLSYIVLFLGISAYLVLIRQRKLLILVLLSVLVAGGSLVAQVKYNLLPSVIYSEIRGQLSVGTLKEQATNNMTLRSKISTFMSRIRKAAPDSANPEGLASATGRLPLWRELWERQQVNPLLGYGFGGFWLETLGPSKQTWLKLRWKPRMAHNGYLDLMLELGFVGLMLFITGFSLTFYRAMRQLPMTSFEPVSLYFPAVLVYMLLANIGESALFTPNLFFWVCYVTSVISLFIGPSDALSIRE